MAHIVSNTGAVELTFEQLAQHQLLLHDSQVNRLFHSKWDEVRRFHGRLERHFHR